MTGDELDQALRERGFSMSYDVALRSFGSRKINVIKAVRELTRWGLKQAKDAVEALETILRGVSREAAAAALAKLEKAGASVELERGESCLYAFSPEDPRRGDQPIERLRLAGLGLARESGELGHWRRSELAQLPGARALLAAVDEQREAWATAGKHTTSDESTVLERVAARDRVGEERLRTSDDDARALEVQVLGDWLQSVGDPRGRIAAAALAIEQSGATRKQLEQFDALIEAHMSHLFGPARTLLLGACWTWSGPVLDSLTLGEGLRSATREQLAELLAVPACACLRSLTLEHPTREDRQLADIVAASECAPGLRELRLPAMSEERFAGDRFARLRVLGFARDRAPSSLHAGVVSFGRARLPALRELELAMTVQLGPLRESFAGLDAPQLETLVFDLATYDYWDQNFGPLHRQLANLLTLPCFARLRSLEIALSETSVPLMPGLADVLAQLPARATLERVILADARLTDECRAELEAARGRLPPLLLPDP